MADGAKRSRMARMGCDCGGDEEVMMEAKCESGTVKRHYQVGDVVGVGNEAL